MLKETRSHCTPTRHTPPRPIANPRSQVLLGSALAVLSGTSPAFAEFDAEKYLIYGFGELSLRPRLEVHEVYDSNLFYAEKDEVDDFITRIRPGLSLVYGSSLDNNVTISYSTDITEYASNNVLDYIGHIVQNRTQLRFTRLSILGQDSFTLSRSTLGGTFSYIQRPVGLTTLTDNWKADYDLSPKTLIGAEINFIRYDYDASDLGTYRLYDFTSFNGSVRAGYRPSEKIVFFPQVSYGQSFLGKNQSTAPDAPDLSSLGFSVGAQGEFSPKITGLITAGYELREYEDGTDLPDGWIANIEARWQARPKTLVAVGYRHMIQVSQELRGVAMIIDRPYASVTQQIGTEGRWNVVLDAYYQLQDHSSDYAIFGATETRQDDLFGVGFQAGYRWTPWFNTSARYELLSYSDNIPSIPDYDVHRFTLRLSAGF
jgi:hypothetical protein